MTPPCFAHILSTLLRINHAVLEFDQMEDLVKMAAITEGFKRQLELLGIGNYPPDKASYPEHLEATGELLRSWRCSNDVVAAGRLHSIYSRDGFPSVYIDPNQHARAKMAKLVGEKVERLLFLFDIMHFESFEKSINTPSGSFAPLIVNRRTLHSLLNVTNDEHTSLGWIVFADGIEMHIRFPEGHQSRPEKSFLEKLSGRLGPAAEKAYKDVFETR